ncbi:MULTISPECIES: hypothetical protein [unclassified Sphingomonas]|uniref:hypothetical protein n=1 Tax=unclassified Sphingomonas TaxID=196159 RepID=UPI000A95627E|nr:MULTISPECIES: hypothetical protein [unclassified Sphingomonas]
MGQDRNGKSSRLSEHFHKVRLTSLLLSVSLFLSTIHGSGKVITNLLPTDIPEADIPFIIFCLVVAATVSFLHAWIIWVGEVKDVDASLQPAGEMVGEIDSVTKSCENVLLRVHVPLDEIKNQYSSLQISSPPERFAILDQERIIDSIKQSPTLQNAEHLITHVIDEALASIYGKELREATVNGLAEAAWTSLGNTVQKPAYLTMRAAMDRFLDERVARFTTWPPSIKNTSAPPTIAQFVSNLELEIRRLVNQNSDQATELRSQLDAVQRRVEAAVHTSRSALVPELQALRRQMADALTPLTRAVRTTKVQVRLFDLAVPGAIYLIALAHALGRLFTPIFPSAATVTTAIFDRLTEIGWWAEALVATALLAPVVVLMTWSYSPRGPVNGSSIVSRLKIHLFSARKNSQD